MKLQRYDFGGLNRRSGDRGRRSPPLSRSPAARRRALLIRYGAVAALLLAMVGFKQIADHGPARPVEDAPVAAAGLGGNAPGTATPAGETRPGISLSSPGLDLHAPFRRYPEPDTFEVGGHALVADYAADSLVHSRIGVYLERYHPDAAVVLACDLGTGRMLGVGERNDSIIIGTPRLAFQSGFPAASLIKILTATAALELQGRDPQDSIPQLGSYHTLYRRQLKVGPSDRGPKVTLKEAFSKSVNPAFGVLGQDLGGASLLKVAEGMGFNRPFACLKPSLFSPPDTGYALAEASCGFTGLTTISPMHALAIARGIGDDGRLRYPSFARSLTDLTGKQELDPRPEPGRAFVSPANLPKLQILMEATVRSGTGRKGFHQVMRGSHLEKLDVGGKTGSLDGLDPKGRYDWFIGYARRKDDPSRGLALSIMLVHGEYANVRSTVLAALLIRDWLAAEEKAMKRAAADSALTGRTDASRSSRPVPADLTRAQAS